MRPSASLPHKKKEKKKRKIKKRVPCPYAKKRYRNCALKECGFFRDPE